MLIDAEAFHCETKLILLFIYFILFFNLLYIFFLLPFSLLIPTSQTDPPGDDRSFNSLTVSYASVSLFLLLCGWFSECRRMGEADIRFSN